MSAGGDRKVIFALFGIAVLCLIGLGATLYHAKATDLAKLQQTLQQKETELEDVQRKLTQLPALEAKYGEVQAQLSVLEPALPDSAYIPTFLRQIEGLATGTNNTILMIRPKASVQRAPGPTATINDETGEITQSKEQAESSGEAAAMPYDFVPIELRLEGTYWTVIDFLAALQKFPKMIAANDIAFSPTQGGAAGAQRSPKLTATMDLTAVVTKGDKDAKSA